MKQVFILQHRLLHYRTALFEQLKQQCLEKGIELNLVHGGATRRELPKNDEGTLPWAHKVENKVWEIGERDILWQPLPKELKNADLVIVMQESRLLSNYWLLLSRLRSSRKIAYWGHGRNFQTTKASGLRERWKKFTLKAVDWWFAYTEMTVDILKEAKYPANKITCLENAIDTSGFKADLASWSDEAIDAEKAQLGIEAEAKIGLFCGSLYPDKKLELLIESSDLVREQDSAFHLIVIGNGPSMPYMEEAAKTRPWIHLVGVQKGKQKALYFRMSDFMLNPGLVGLHIVDAFCAGLVMITTKTARHSPEVAYLKDGENGIYTEDSPMNYSSSIISLIKDPARLEQFRENAFKESEHYTLENMVKNFADGIEAALND